MHSYIYNIYIYISSSSSSCRAASTDIPGPLSPLLPIIHRLWQAFRLHPVSSHSCCMYVWAGRPAFAWPYVGVHRSTLLMSSSLLLQQCPACLVRPTCIVFVMGGKWPYCWCLVGCCRQDLFSIALNKRLKKKLYIYIYIFTCYDIVAVISGYMSPVIHTHTYIYMNEYCIYNIIFGHTRIINLFPSC